MIIICSSIRLLKKWKFGILDFTFLKKRWNFLFLFLVQTENKAQLKAVAESLDSKEADVLYIVGGDGTVSDVLSAIYNSEKNAELPIGIFPAGKENYSLVNLSPFVFCEFICLLLTNFFRIIFSLIQKK